MYCLLDTDVEAHLAGDILKKKKLGYLKGHDGHTFTVILPSVTRTLDNSNSR